MGTCLCKIFGKLRDRPRVPNYYVPYKKNWVYELSVTSCVNVRVPLASPTRTQTAFRDMASASSRREVEEAINSNPKLISDIEKCTNWIKENE